MDITVYLPDEIAQRAKAQNVNLSRILRDALTDRFAKEDAVSITLDSAETITLDLQTEEGRAYRGRLTAVLIGRAATEPIDIYLRRNGEVIAYRPDDGTLVTVADPENDLRSILPAPDYIVVMEALGIVAEIDLDDQVLDAATLAPPAGTGPRSAAGAARKLRSVPGDLVEPPVSFIKRLAGHGDDPKRDGADDAVTASVGSTSSEGPAATGEQASEVGAT